jgi:hypothetical protein
VEDQTDLKMWEEAWDDVQREDSFTQQLRHELQTK